MGTILTTRINRILKGIILTLIECGKGAGYAIHH
jgi:hypothetical protein